MREVVVIGDGSVNSLGLVRSLGESGLCVTLLHNESKNSHRIAHVSKYVQHSIYCADDVAILDNLLSREGSDKCRIPVLCGSDHIANLLDRSYNRLRDRYGIFNVDKKQGELTRYLDKIATFDVARACGLNLIPTWNIDKSSIIPDDISYPCLVKGSHALSSSKDDIQVCLNREELLQALSTGRTYSVQRYINKEFELDINGVSLNRGEHIIMPGVVRKIRETYTRQSDFIVLEHIPEGFDVEAVKRFIRMLKYEGLFSVEFLFSEGVYYFLEINLRNDGVSYLYTVGGVNLPALWAMYFDKEQIPCDVYHNRLKTPIYLMQIYDLANLKSRTVSLLTWVKDFLRTRAFFVWNWKDPMPFFASLGLQIWRKITKV